MAMIIDVTNPPTPLAAANPNSNNDDTAAIQAILNYAADEDNRTQAIVEFPPGGNPTANTEGYVISSTLVIPLCQGLRLQGAGLAASDTTGPNKSANSYFRWTGDANGPIMEIRNNGGFVMDGLNFHGNGAATVVRNNETVSAGALLFNISNCGFHNGNTLFQNDSDLGTTVANMIFTNCVFDGEHTSFSRERYGFYNRHAQGLQFLFNECEFRDCGYCFYFVNGGKLTVIGGGSANCGTILHREEGGQNTSGFNITNFFVDRGGTRKTLAYSSGSVGEGRTFGNITFQNFDQGNNFPSDAATFATITSWVGTTLTISDTIDMAPGHRIKFYPSSDHDSPYDDTTTVVTKISHTQYEVAHTCCVLTSLPADLTTVDVAHGDSTFELTGGETLSVRDCFFENSTNQGNRLITLREGTFSGGRVPWALFEMCRGLIVASADDLYDKYVYQPDMGDTVYYRFRDCGDFTSTALSVPYSKTNIP